MLNSCWGRPGRGRVFWNKMYTFSYMLDSSLTPVGLGLTYFLIQYLRHCLKTGLKLDWPGLRRLVFLRRSVQWRQTTQLGPYNILRLRTRVQEAQCPRNPKKTRKAKLKEKEGKVGFERTLYWGPCRRTAARGIQRPQKREQRRCAFLTIVTAPKRSAADRTLDPHCSDMMGPRSLSH